jgi:hypothetical protein
MVLLLARRVKPIAELGLRVGAGVPRHDQAASCVAKIGAQKRIKKKRVHEEK